MRDQERAELATALFFVKSPRTAMLPLSVMCLFSSPGWRFPDTRKYFAAAESFCWTFPLAYVSYTAWEQVSHEISHDFQKSHKTKEKTEISGGSNPVSCCFVKPCKYRKILIFARFFVVLSGQ